jgi:predicted ATPase
MLGYPDAALADVDRALREAREIEHGATLMYVLAFTTLTLIHCGKYAATEPLIDEVIGLATEKDATNWKPLGIMNRGVLMTHTGRALIAVTVITEGIATWRSTGARLFTPLYLSYLPKAHAEIGQFDEARRRACQAIETIKATKENWWEAEIHRVAGDIALKSPERDVAKAEAYFERALEVARQQQAKSWELRAAMSLARLWRDQRKLREARELLAPVYGWFTEGFDALDLKEAKALLEELST